MKLLHIDTSILGAHSVSRELTALIVQKLSDSGGVDITYRDLVTAPLPHLTLAGLPSTHPAAAYAGQLDAAGTVLRTESDHTLDEFVAADTVVIGVPMYNFTVPTQLKSWIDRVVVPGKTFKISEGGIPEGLMQGKRVIAAMSRGGFYGAGTATVSAEHAESWLRSILGFIGIKPEFVVAEGMNLGETSKAQAIASARNAVGQLDSPA